MTRDELIDWLTKKSEQIYEGHPPTYEHAPMLFIASRAEVIPVLLAMTEGEEGKIATRQVIDQVVAMPGCTAIALVMEAWVAQGQLAKQAEDLGGVSQLPPDDRMEILLIHAANRSGIKSVMRKIIRGRDKVTLDKVDPDWETTAGTSRFLSNLKWGPQR